MGLAQDKIERFIDREEFADKEVFLCENCNMFCSELVMKGDLAVCRDCSGVIQAEYDKIKTSLSKIKKLKIGDLEWVTTEIENLIEALEVL